MTKCYHNYVNQAIGTNPLNDTLYKTVHWLGAPMRFRLIGLENIRDSGPAIYTGNHLASEGPIAITLSLPVRFYTWTIAEMLDFKRASQYLYDDFVHPTWHLNGWAGGTVSYLVSRISVVLLTGLGSISVDRSRGGFSEPFRRNLELLMQGKNLLILPEDPKTPLKPETQMRPFMVGFTWLCHMFFKETGQLLPVYPLAAFLRSRTISIGEPLYFPHEGDPRQQIRVFGRQVEREVKALYLALANQ